MTQIVILLSVTIHKFYLLPDRSPTEMEMVRSMKRFFSSKGDSQYRLCIFLDVFRVVMRGSIFPTGHIVMPVFACADKGDYVVSAGSTITVKFNAKDGEVNDEDFCSSRKRFFSSKGDSQCVRLSCCDARKYDAGCGFCWLYYHREVQR